MGESGDVVAAMKLPRLIKLAKEHNTERKSVGLYRQEPRVNANRLNSPLGIHLEENIYRIP
jgi:hypothetical protein